MMPQFVHVRRHVRSGGLVRPYPRKAPRSASPASRVLREGPAWTLPTGLELEASHRLPFDEGGFDPEDWDEGRLEWKTPEAFLGGSSAPLTPEKMASQSKEFMYYGDTDQVSIYQTEVVDHLRYRLREGLPIDPVAQAFGKDGNEDMFAGLHRAVAAYMERTRLIPVWVFHRAEDR